MFLIGTTSFSVPFLRITDIFSIASTLSGKGIMPCLVILKPRYSSTYLAKKDFSVFTLKSADLSLIKKLSPKINFILGDNAVEPKGVKSNYFGEGSESFKFK